MDELQLVADKQRSDKTKQLVKNLLQKIDDGKTGLVKREVFESILSLHNVSLSQQHMTRLLKETKSAGDVVNYKEALRRISINMDVADPLLK